MAAFVNSIYGLDNSVYEHLATGLIEPADTAPAFCVRVANFVKRGLVFYNSGSLCVAPLRRSPTPPQELA
jgi:hypothetical protein